ncbi:MAG: phosphotransferase [Zoogloeaceae bacterium]|jgi:aminoglycoside/choline kinase family phosphotransferase|nr:phosphotransferase [Zoogloeaceae bacterium]
MSEDQEKARGLRNETVNDKIRAFYPKAQALILMSFVLVTPRDAALADWVAARAAPFFQAAPEAIRVEPVSADASFRRYFRIFSPEGATRILMDAPPDKEDNHAFARVADLMTEAGVRAPRVEIADFDAGFLLLTDLGSADYLGALRKTPDRADTLMRAALETLIRWQKSTRAGTLPPYDEALLRRELELFPEWFMTRRLRRPPDKEQRAALDALFSVLVNAALAQPRVFTHRDFMPRNLMVLEDGAPGVLDFQDAVEGPLTYDVVSLFRDAFLSWEEEQELDWVVRYWEQARSAGLPVRSDFGVFWQEYEWMGLQRHLKVLGIFCRLCYRDSKPRYLSDLPRFMQYARKTAERYSELTPLARLFDTLENKAEETFLTF